MSPWKGRSMKNEVLAKVVESCGGKLVTPALPLREKWAKDLERFAPGCGSPTNVAGTNGGKMPCGARLTSFGKTEQHFCGACAKRMERPKEEARTGWRAEGRPPVKEDYGSFFHSEDVLVTDGKQVWAAYLQTWENEEYPAVWKMKGRDGYDIEGVTHWMPMPETPA